MTMILNLIKIQIEARLKQWSGGPGGWGKRKMKVEKMEQWGIEPQASCMRNKRSTN